MDSKKDEIATKKARMIRDYMIYQQGSINEADATASANSVPNSNGQFLSPMDLTVGSNTGNIGARALDLSKVHVKVENDQNPSSSKALSTLPSNSNNVHVQDDQIPSSSKSKGPLTGTETKNTTNILPVIKPEISGDVKINPHTEMIRRLLPKSMRESQQSGPILKGPIYEYKPGFSLALWVPPKNELFSPQNPNGYVPVVVHPMIAVEKEKHNKSSPNTNSTTPVEKLNSVQKEGLSYLWTKYNQGKGCLLAHEMGLGKTFTTIAFIITLFEQSEKSPQKSTGSLSKVLILSPKSVVEIWETEFQLRIPKEKKNLFEIVKVIPYMKESVVLDIFLNYFGKPNKKAVMIMSYDSFKKYAMNMEADIKEYKGGIDLLVCDEVHLLKNSDTQRVKALKYFRKGDRKSITVGISGTPFQNNLVQLCTVIDLIRPAIMDDYKLICKRISAHFIRIKNKCGVWSGIDDEDDYYTSKDYVLAAMGRIKSNIKEVIQYKVNNYKVAKNEFIICSSLSTGLHPIQKEMYRDFTTFLQVENAQLKKDEGKVTFYEAITILKKICIHPKYGCEALRFPQRASKGLPVPPSLTMICDNYDKSVDIMKNHEDEETRQHCELGWLDLIQSSKIKLVFSIINEIYEKNKERDKMDFEQVVIASESLELLNIISTACTKFYHYKFLQLDGKTNMRNRQSHVKEFQSDKENFIFLLSAKTGSTGLTLTAANHLILLEPGWNPFDDRQTIFRIYRTTQLKDVFIYRIFSTGTIEEMIYLNQLSKEAFDKYLKDEKNDIDLTTLAGPNTMAQYYTYHGEGGSSYIFEELRNREENNDNDNDNGLEQRGLGYVEENEEYTQFDQIPQELDIIKNVWADSISNGFPISLILHSKIKGRGEEETRDVDEDMKLDEFIQVMAEKSIESNDNDSTQDSPLI